MRKTANIYQDLIQSISEKNSCSNTYEQPVQNAQAPYYFGMNCSASHFLQQGQVSLEKPALKKLHSFQKCGVVKDTTRLSRRRTKLSAHLLQNNALSHGVLHHACFLKSTMHHLLIEYSIPCEYELISEQKVCFEIYTFGTLLQLLLCETHIFSMIIRQQLLNSFEVIGVENTLKLQRHI